jgi:hypothetical protein
MTTRYQTDLANLYKLFRISALSLAVGFLVLWVGLADITLATIGENSYVLDPLTFEACGTVLILVGITLLSVAIYQKISYPAKLATVTKSLKDLDDLLHHEKVFAQTVRKTLGQPYHAHYEDYVKQRQAQERRVKQMMSVQTFIRVYRFPIALIGGGLSVIIPALLASPIYSEPLIAGGVAILLGAFWGLLNHRKHITNPE